MSGDVSNVGAVGAVDAEPDRLVQTDRCRVVSIDVQHADANAGASRGRPGEVVEAGESQGSTKAQTVEVGVDSNDIDLAEYRVVVGVDLRPAKSAEPAVIPSGDRDP